MSDHDELSVTVRLEEGKTAYSRDEVGQLMGNAAAQAYRQGYADAMARMPVVQPPEHMQ